MKDKPVVIIVMLLGGAVSCICCIVNGAGLLWTLLITLITLFVFMLIGLGVNKVYTSIKADLDAIKEKEKRLEEERQKEEEALQKERDEWNMFHPDEPFPGDLELEKAEETEGTEQPAEEESENTPDLIFTEEGA